MDRQTEKDDRGQRRARGKGFLARFLRDREGATAIEFTLLAIPFTVLVFAILESCISFAAQEVLANATDNVARQIRTGRFEKADITEKAVKDSICDQLGIIVASGCPGLMVDLRTFTKFQDAAKLGFGIGNGDIVLTNNGAIDKFVITPGDATEKNMLRVFYKWPVLTDITALWMANLGNRTTVHFASAVWQNEPFN